MPGAWIWGLQQSPLQDLQLLEKTVSFAADFYILVLAVDWWLFLLKVFLHPGGSCVVSLLEQHSSVVPVSSLCSRSCGNDGLSLAMILWGLLPSAPVSGWWEALLRFIYCVTSCSLVLAPCTEAARCCEKVEHPTQALFSWAELVGMCQ